MAVHRRIEVTSLTGSAGNVAMVKVLDRKIIDAAKIANVASINAVTEKPANP